MISTEVTIALVVSGLALLGTIITTLTSAKKNEVEILRGIIKELKDYVSELECNVEDLQDWAERLVSQVKNAGMEPVRFIRSVKKDKL